MMERIVENRECYMGDVRWFIALIKDCTKKGINR